ncbi:hypothetical protein GCM10025331_81090 [Actinoplanes utahensis]|uniref:Uncharacterized protein n=1 Tax=Actinoplanes utahensis TaxID=1869 RepID=A0A0A6X026_ACTUT|nr:hypothetical protein MB27_34515 [Actinoplanes utahensis]GIF30097.1 hypothetical protein Aut01nite_30830 [Actinoplanes utahensis]
MSSSHSIWSSTLRFSASRVVRPVARSYTAISHWPSACPLRVLMATRVPSGDSAGHSASSRSATSFRSLMLPSTSQVFAPDAAVA